MAGAEIVDYDPCAGALQRLEVFADHCHIDQQSSLGHFHLKAGRTQTGLPKNIENPRREA